MLFDEHDFEKFFKCPNLHTFGCLRMCIQYGEKTTMCVFVRFLDKFDKFCVSVRASSTRSGRRGVKVRSRASICDSIRTGSSEKSRRTDDRTNHGGRKGLGFD